jgi:hypothetical protein
MALAPQGVPALRAVPRRVRHLGEPATVRLPVRLGRDALSRDEGDLHSRHLPHGGRLLSSSLDWPQNAYGAPWSRTPSRISLA